MKRLLPIIGLIIMVSCKSEPQLLKNGLTKSANKTTEYTILIHDDPLETRDRDTSMIKTTTFRSDDQILQVKTENLKNNTSVDMMYHYDSEGILRNQFIKSSTDSVTFVLDYYYKNSILDKITGITDNDKKKKAMLQNSFYRKDGTLNETVVESIEVDKLQNDTIYYFVQSTFFDEKERMDSSYMDNLIDPTSSMITKTEYEGNEMVKMTKSSPNSSLHEAITFEYKKDKFGNWIEQRMYKDEQLGSVVSRVIEYR